MTHLHLCSVKYEIYGFISGWGYEWITVYNACTYVTYKYVLQHPSEMQIHSILKQYPLPALTGWILSQQNLHFQHRLCQSPPIDTIFRKFHPPLLHILYLLLSSPSVCTLELPQQNSVCSHSLSHFIYMPANRGFLGSTTASYLEFFTLFSGQLFFCTLRCQALVICVFL